MCPPPGPGPAPAVRPKGLRPRPGGGAEPALTTRPVASLCLPVRITRVFLSWADGGIFGLSPPRAAGCAELGVPGTGVRSSGCVVPR